MGTRIVDLILLRPGIALVIAVALLANNGSLNVGWADETASKKPALGTIYLDDSSDWWSWGRAEETGTSAEEFAGRSTGTSPQASDVAKFSILGISLSDADREDWLKNIENKLGAAKIVERG